MPTMPITYSTRRSDGFFIIIHTILRSIEFNRDPIYIGIMRRRTTKNRARKRETHRCCYVLDAVLQRLWSTSSGSCRRVPHHTCVNSHLSSFIIDFCECLPKKGEALLMMTLFSTSLCALYFFFFFIWKQRLIKGSERNKLSRDAKFPLNFPFSSSSSSCAQRNERHFAATEDRIWLFCG